MSLKTISSLFIGTLLSLSAHATGFDVGNGGDSVLCQPSPDNSFKGYYSLDYLLTLQTDNSDLEAPFSWAESRDRIQRIFDKNDSDFGTFFREFIAKVPGEAELPPDYRWIQDRIWEESPYGLIDIKDEQMTRQLPKNCQTLNDNQLELIQTVIRNRKPTATFYSYDPKILAELKTTNPLQYSFLIVHEWLWDFIDDPNTLRRINRFIHSNAFMLLTQVELRKALTNLGLTLTYGTPMPVCERSADFQTLLVHAAGKTCEQIDMANFQTQPARAVLGNKMGLTRLLPGDFSGLSDIHTMQLDDNQFDSLLENTFTGLTSLYSLTLNGNKLKDLPLGLFAPLPALNHFEIRNNTLTEIPMALTDMFHQHGESNSLYFDLGNNQITTVNPDFLIQVCNYVDQFSTDYIHRVTVSIDVQGTGNTLASMPDFDRVIQACSQRKAGYLRWVVDAHMRNNPSAHDTLVNLSRTGEVDCLTTAADHNLTSCL